MASLFYYVFEISTYNLFILASSTHYFFPCNITFFHFCIFFLTGQPGLVFNFIFQINISLNALHVSLSSGVDTVRYTTEDNCHIKTCYLKIIKGPLQECSMGRIYLSLCMVKIYTIYIIFCNFKFHFSFTVAPLNVLVRISSWAFHNHIFITWCLFSSGFLNNGS